MFAPTLSEERWDWTLRQAQFSGLDGCSKFSEQGPNEGSVMFSTAKPLVKASDVDYNIITDLDPSDLLVQELRGSLQRLNKDVTHVASLEETSVAAAHYILLEMDRPFLQDMNEKRLSQLQSLTAKAKGILWITHGTSSGYSNPHGNMILGLSRSIRSEMTAFRLFSFEFSKLGISSISQMAETIVRLSNFVFSADRKAKTPIDSEFIEEDGIIKIPRILHDDEKDKFVKRQTGEPEQEERRFGQIGSRLKLVSKTPGLLESLCFLEADYNPDTLGDEEVQIDVKATGINFKDVMISLGQIAYRELGQECSGVVTAVGEKVNGLTPGDRVCVITSESYATSVRTKEILATKIPDDMTFATAASIPVVFCTSYYALIDQARLASGQTVLIHAVAGGVGQAAIMLSQAVGAEVFVTVGTAEKRNFLKERYNIGEDHIFSSRDLSFEGGVLRATKGKGVDVILNSTSGEALQRTWNCVKPLGRFVEIGKRDLEVNNRLEMSPFLKSVSFIAVDLEVLITHDPAKVRWLCGKVLDMMKEGSISPVSPVASYSMSNLTKAFRRMQGGNHVGKLVIEAHSDDLVKVRQSSRGLVGFRCG